MLFLYKIILLKKSFPTVYFKIIVPCIITWYEEMLFLYCFICPLYNTLINNILFAYIWQND